MMTFAQTRKIPITAPIDHKSQSRTKAKNREEKIVINKNIRQWEQRGERFAKVNANLHIMKNTLK